MLALVAVPGAPPAHASTGGAPAYAEPEVSALKCGTGAQTSCPQGAVLRLSGKNLADTKTVIFLGARGSRDDTRARPQTASPHRVIVTVPAAARSGNLRVLAADAAAVGPRLQVLPVVVAGPAQASPALGALAAVFPVQGAHDYGTFVNAFGGGRGHQGQDVLAACGLPIVAALAGTVTLTRFQERAGNYVVVKALDGTSHVYMHMLSSATVAKGQTVTAGQPLGQVGQTGDATTCHLHFELWTAPGWYAGGQPIDPLPFLRAADTPG
jgi:murein DD-endopeptidase MepM/ murein hydrolase activator NlpD